MIMVEYNCKDTPLTSDYAEQAVDEPPGGSTADRHGGS